MNPLGLTRRRLIQLFMGVVGSLSLSDCVRGKEEALLTLYTFGDSILDCGHYNEWGINPGQLLVRNNDRLFPEFRGRDLSSQSPANLEHHAQNGATVAALSWQAQGLQVKEPGLALITIGGNDLLQGLLYDEGEGIKAFSKALDQFVRELPLRPVLLGNVYDPTFGKDEHNFLPIEAKVARQKLQQVNVVIQEVANHYGQLVDLYSHFLQGESSWLTAMIEPSLAGASEIRRAFLPYVLEASAAF